MHEESHFLFFIAAIIVGTSLLSGVGGPKHLAGSSPGEECQRWLKAYTSALHAIEENYAEPIQRDKIFYGSIQTMLETLDPHSVFLDPLSFSYSNEEMRGNYCGRGITCGVMRGKPTAANRTRPLVLPKGCSRFYPHSCPALIVILCMRFYCLRATADCPGQHWEGSSE